MAEKEKKETRTTDLALAAYLKLRGLRLLRTEKDEFDRTAFVFDDSMDVAELLKVEFANSECCKFDGELRHLKKLIFRS
ncbi:MAG TPA: hypothetical protein GXX51_05700 [Firmicutes bacterium]|nr:hypothetical protein [Bacillota bacterium]